MLVWALRLRYCSAYRHLVFNRQIVLYAITLTEFNQDDADGADDEDGERVGLHLNDSMKKSLMKVDGFFLFFVSRRHCLCALFRLVVNLSLWLAFAFCASNSTRLAIDVLILPSDIQSMGRAYNKRKSSALISFAMNDNDPVCSSVFLCFAVYVCMCVCLCVCVCVYVCADQHHRHEYLSLRFRYLALLIFDMANAMLDERPS